MTQLDKSSVGSNRQDELFYKTRTAIYNKRYYDKNKEKLIDNQKIYKKSQKRKDYMNKRYAYKTECQRLLSICPIIFFD